MSSASSKKIEGIIVVTVVVILTVWYGYQSFRPRVGAASTLNTTAVNSLTSASLQQAADVASNEQSRYTVPVPAPSADELGKDQLF